MLGKYLQMGMIKVEYDIPIFIGFCYIGLCHKTSELVQEAGRINEKES